MNKKNFNSIQNFSVPQNWIDNAVNIPKTATKKPKVLFVNFSKTIAAVASLVIVCCVSLIVFFMNGDNAVPPVSVVETKGTSIIFDKTENTQSEVKETSSEKESSTIENKESITLSDNQKPTIVTPTEIETLPVEPTEAPTQKPSTGDSGSTNYPTEDELPLAPAPTDDMIYPTEGYEPIYPTAPGFAPTENKDDIFVFTLIFDTSLLKGNKIYCMTYLDGKLCGSSQLFSVQNETEIEVYEDLIIVRYYPYRKGVVSKSGSYNFYFYNEQANLVATATKRLEY